MAVHAGSGDDLDPTLAHVIDSEQPIFPRVGLERDVVDAGDAKAEKTTKAASTSRDTACSFSPRTTTW